MKMYTLKFYLIALGLAFLIPAVNAQFDDVYYDPDNNVVEHDYNTAETDSGYTSSDEVTYYDNDEYAYYDDYDYYYSSRIKRFYRPSYGLNFYDPYYIDAYNYDPYYADSYYYPGATIYLSFGNSSYWDYRHWRRWNRWNSYSHFDNWCHTPTSYYYAYNNWCSPSYNYWGGYNGYYSYSNYYNNYYNTCPYPVSNYYGITHSTVTNVNSGSTRGTYYGPRITGNTGSSPRGPVSNPGLVQPVYKDKDGGITQSNDNPRQTEGGLKPGNIVSPTPEVPGTDRSPRTQPAIKEDNTKGNSKEILVDREIKRENPTPSPQRPVFKPESEKFKPYPTNERNGAGSDKPVVEKPAYNPPAPRENYNPAPTQNRPENTTRENDRPTYTPSPRNGNERPSYSPPARNNDSGRSNERPSYSPPPRNNDAGRSNERPSYTPPSRNSDAGRSNDRPSASPSHNNNNSSNSGGSRTEPSRNSTPSSSGSSPRGRG